MLNLRSTRSMLAVLESAIQDFQLAGIPTTRPQPFARAAEAWLGKENTRWHFAFLGVFNSLGSEPSYLRREPKRFQTRQSSLLWMTPGEVVLFLSILPDAPQSSP